MFGFSAPNAVVQINNNTRQIKLRMEISLKWWLPFTNHVSRRER
jgi:hypothetical protein